MRETEREETSGTEPSVRVVERAARLLRALAGYACQGATFTELLNDVNLGKATTHRLLSALADAGLIYQDALSKRYGLASAVAEMGRSAIAQRIVALAQPSLEHLAHETMDTVFASVVEGSGSVCVARALGSFPIRTLTLSVGDRRPLGVGSGSLALLSALPDEQVSTVLERNVRWLRGYPGHAPADLLKAVGETRRNGFALIRGSIVPGMSAVATAALDERGLPMVALAVAAIADRMSSQRVDQLAKLLERESAAVGRLAQEA